MINYSLSLHDEQGCKIINKSTNKDLIEFLLDRLRYYMKEKKIRADIIEASIYSHNLDNINKIYKKASKLNNVIYKEVGMNLISSYKRAANILENELNNREQEISNSVDPGNFKNDFEKNLFKKIKELNKYFSSINADEQYEQTLINLSSASIVISQFFDNVIVNDDDKTIKKNRLELLQMLCKTFENYINFSKIESIK